MKTYLINLDCDTERLSSATMQLKALNVPFERVPAVYGKDLSEFERGLSYNHFRWWCAVGRPIRHGEIGCALSHYSVYRKMIETGVKYACVLEDDVILAKDFSDRVREVESNIMLERPQVYLLSNHTNGRETGLGICKSQGDRHSEGYVLTLPAAKALLRENMPLKVPCDYWDRWVRIGAIELYHALPSVCSPNEEAFESNTAPLGKFVVDELPPISWAWHKFKRLVGICIDRLLENI